MQFGEEIQGSIDYLNSEEALNSLQQDPYWPKWNSPWWHMLLLHEMGETARIPQRVVEAHVQSLNRIPLKIFPVHKHEMPDHIDPFRGTPCHCQLGNVYQVLAARGVDVDSELPWIRPWFLKYQMADGGLNCDNDAYLATDEVPSSMVGTIAVFEAVLLYTKRPFTEREQNFLHKGAQFLISRKLVHGSETKHNAAERKSAEDWVKLCFPRYYLYDILRGLNALTLWAEKMQGPVPKSAIEPAMAALEKKFPSGHVMKERQSFEGAGSLLQAPSGEWLRKQPATFFPLLTKTSTLNEISPFLSRQWKIVQERVATLRKAGLMTQ